MDLRKAPYGARNRPVKVLGGARCGQSKAKLAKPRPWNQCLPDRLARAAMLDTQPTARWNQRPNEVTVSSQFSALTASRSRIGRKSAGIAPGEK
jgi:hypothetical protein